jgi:hypothetical protein
MIRNSYQVAHARHQHNALGLAQLPGKRHQINTQKVDFLIILTAKFKSFIEISNFRLLIF